MNLKQNESGRSMVEMLGMLAVMGVISIGGVYGYTKAMERHRANELLNEANKRAVMVASQFMAGRDPENVKTEEFPEETPYGTFSANITSDGNDKFKMTVSGLDEEMCNLLTRFAGGPIRRVACIEGENSSFTAELSFNNDLSTEERASDYASPDTCKSPYKWCSGLGTKGQCSNNADCCAGITLNQCQESCNTSTGEIINVANSPATSCTITTPNDGTCINGKCVLDRTGQPCYYADNSECGGRNSDYYCEIKSYTTNGSCTETNTNYFTSITGTCQRVSNIGHTDADVTGLGSVRRSNSTMNWWSANNWCQAQGKNLIDVRDFQAYRSGTDTLVVEGSEWSYGCAQGKTCGNWDTSWPYMKMWSGNNLTELKDENGERYQDKFSPVLKDLRVKFNTTNTFWTKSSYGNTSPNSCFAFDVGLFYGNVDGISRDIDRFDYVLCR